MNDVEKRRGMIINVIYFAMIVAIAFLLIRYALGVCFPFLFAFLLAALVQKPKNFLVRKTPLKNGAASVIWETDWSLTKMTVVHLLVISLTMLPIAYLMRWMNRTVRGVLLYIVFFLVLYAIIWIISYRRTQRQLREINKKLNA